MHYYKRNLGDYAKKAGRLSMLQHGAYTLLMDSCYDREQFPTIEEAIDWAWASSKEEIEAVEFVLKKFFILQDGVYVQPRIKEEVDEYQAKAETNKRIAREREEKRRAKMAKRSDSSTSRARTVDEPSAPEHEPPPNQEPRTINQEPVTSNQEKENTPVGGKPPPCPHQEIVDLYHEHCPTLPRVKVWTDARRKSLQARWREDKKRQDLTYWAEFFQYVDSVPFLRGDKTFQADLEWLVTARNFVKVIEGKYEDREAA